MATAWYTVPTALGEGDYRLPNNLHAKPNAALFRSVSDESVTGRAYGSLRHPTPDAFCLVCAALTRCALRVDLNDFRLRRTLLAETAFESIQAKKKLSKTSKKTAATQ